MAYGTLNGAINDMKDMAEECECLGKICDIGTVVDSIDKLEDGFCVTCEGDTINVTVAEESNHHSAKIEGDEATMISGDESEFLRLCEEYVQA